jgi:hypothetical protein
MKFVRKFEQMRALVLACLAVLHHRRRPGSGRKFHGRYARDLELQRRDQTLICAPSPRSVVGRYAKFSVERHHERVYALYARLVDGSPQGAVYGRAFIRSIGA